jgi:hypothetical protein
MWRRLSVVATFAMSAVLLIGCTVPSHGKIAIGKDADGQAVAVVQMCSQHVDGIVVYIDDRHSRSWDFTAPVTDSATLTLTGLESWMKPGERYSSLAGSTDGLSSASGPDDFTLTDFESLRAGEVLVAGYHHGEYTVDALTVDDFRKSVLDDCKDLR